ncbi:MAG: WecB/TagA/CpsF family glycosyltransferase [Patescibacteria group bacterium]|nr:WecB/TagA/CpsF family glycosyltransferase [Patescibacteria group bacterium]
MQQNRITILDIPIDQVNFFDALKKIEELVKSGGHHQVATVNPEFIIHSTRDKEFKKALQNSSLNTADGIGILWAAKYQKIKKTKNQENKKISILKNIQYLVSNIFWLKISLLAIIFNRKWLSSEIPERITGIDLMWELANRVQERNWKVFLLNWSGGRSKVWEVEEKLKTLYPRINIVGALDSYPEDRGLVEKIAKTKPDILFVAFGSPKQEIFIHKNLKHLGAKVVIGVGGSFDFIIGKAKRAPSIFQKLGVEWIWRLIQQPKRAGRIYNAFPKFVWEIFKSE